MARLSVILCNTLQHAATRCNTLQHIAAHCNTLQHTATHCTTLHYTATHCNYLGCSVRDGEVVYDNTITLLIMMVLTVGLGVEQVVVTVKERRHFGCLKKPQIFEFFHWYIKYKYTYI